MWLKKSQHPSHKEYINKEQFTEYFPLLFVEMNSANFFKSSIAVAVIGHEQDLTLSLWNDCWGQEVRHSPRWQLFLALVFIVKNYNLLNVCKFFLQNIGFQL